MNATRWARVKEVYGEAVDRPLDQRLGFVLQSTADDEELRRAVLDLLEVDEVAAETRLQPVFADHLAGTVLAGHRLLHELGAGGMGVVYLAEPEGGGAPVAVKILTKVASVRPRAVEMFRREAAAVARLSHQGIVPLLTFGSEGGHWFYVMEYVPGPSLGKLLAMARKGSYQVPVDLSDPVRCASLVASVLEALQHAHENGIIHRDVKPDNILIDADGRPRLVDFGIARDLALEGVTRTGEITGTPYYMSPEQANRVRRPVDHRSDLFSAAAVLYELLTLRRPFEGSDCRQILERIVCAEPKAIRRLNPAVPRGIAMVCRQALSKDPHYRFPSAIVFANLLRTAVRGEPVPIRREPWPRLAWRRLQNHPRLAAAGLGALLVATFFVARGYGIDTTSAAVQLRVAVGPTPSRVEILRYSDDLGAAPIREMMADRVRGEWQRTFPPGRMRICVRRGETVHELYRECGPGERIEVAASADPPADATATMQLVRGGRTTYSVGGGDDRQGVEARVEDFWIDREVVTNRRFVEFLVAEGERDLLDSPRWDAEAGLRVRDDWWDLPATGMTWEMARRHAEWCGKRLPSLAEWHRVMQADERTSSIAEADAPSIAAAFHLDTRSSVINLDSYLRAVRPAREPGRALSHLLGNVWEWVEDPHRERVDGTWQIRPGLRMAVGYGWSSSAEVVASHGLDHRTYVPAVYGPIDVGIRCARSLDP